MRAFDDRWTMPGVAREMRRRAMLGLWTGAGTGCKPYIDNCTACHQPTGTNLIFSRDTEQRILDYWKNPDYERCWHLSLSFIDPESEEIRSRDASLTHDWIDQFFGDHKRLLWTEPPSSDQGKKLGVWHYRLFMHPDWQTPVLPRGEGYSRELTEAGWKSWSDLQGDRDS